MTNRPALHILNKLTVHNFSGLSPNSSAVPLIREKLPESLVGIQ